MSIRRDINDLVRDPQGRMSEAKLFAIFFKLLMLDIFWQNAPVILSDWEVLAVFVTSFVAPDLLKKLISSRAGVVEQGKQWNTEQGRDR